MKCPDLNYNIIYPYSCGDGLRVMHLANEKQ